MSFLVRVIVNLLNQYWLSGRLDKHFDAITKLLQSDFDSFTYTLDDLNKLKFEEYGQGFYDYLCDKLEIIQRTALNRGADWVSQELDELYSLLQQRQFLLTSQDIKSAYLLLANAYSLYPAFSNKAISLYLQAISGLDSIPVSSGIIELSKYYMLVFCMSLFDAKNRCDEEIIEFANAALSITNKDDELYFNAFKIILYAASASAKRQLCNDLEVELNTTLNLGFISQSNNNLLLFLTFVITGIQIQQRQGNNIYKFLPQIDFCLEQYNRYLKHEPYYKKIFETLCSKRALATQDFELISKVVDNYFKVHDNQETGRHYYDILYDKGSICLKDQMIDDAIEIFTYLSDSYNGSYDKAASLQSLALCYMERYKEPQNLVRAEETYNKAMELFAASNDNRMCGNVWDGLSYCYILQRRYQEAEVASLKALKVEEYNASNKYCNYISSLLCQNKRAEAYSFYGSLKDKEAVKHQLIIDWSSEMQNVGINIRHFGDIFN